MLPLALAWLAVTAWAQAPREARVEFSGGGLSYAHSEPAGPDRAPLLIALGGEWAAWQAETARRGWLLAMPEARLLRAPGDAAATALEALVEDARRRLPADENRVYLAGVGAGAEMVFYVRGRVPHLWAAVVGLGGSARPAIESNRLFSANAALVPMLWAAPAAGDGSRERLRAARYPVLERPLAEVRLADALDFLASHRRDPMPPQVDCETGSLKFARCYWVEIVKADPSLRNDAVPPTRVPPGAGASLALGPFGFDPSLPGPGLQVGWLPDGYQGPLKLGDRIVSVGGKPAGDAAEYLRLMDETREEKAVAVMVERGGRRLRLETRTVLPKREENVTVRVRAEWLPESRELLLITRGVAALRFHLSAGRTPARVNWNGREMGEAAGPGCWEAAATLARCR